jgi:preprotein translocase subunit SecA
MLNIFTKIFGSRNERLVKRLRGIAGQINELEAAMRALSEDELRGQTAKFRQRLADNQTLDTLLPEAFATVREAGWRVLEMRHFDVQMIGGMVLDSGKIAEMRTGEGKTLVATLAAYLNALPGKGVHVVTVNDYLAKRDEEWMGRIYRYLGLTTGVIVSNLSPDERRAAYAADITYGTNNEFGFDYLRDNMAFNAAERVQRELNYAIVDEVDSILVDEARTPLIISGATDDTTELYQRVNGLIPRLKRQARLPEKDDAEELPGDYAVDEKNRQVFLSEEGHQHIEDMLTEAGILAEGASLYDTGNIILMHHVNAALRAHTLFEKNVDYIVREDKVIIIDEFTGRALPGRRWSEGLHQAVEAKEGVAVQNESQTLASITFQNYFRLYKKLSGMTGTADTEAFEFQSIYGLEVVVIPTNQAMIRKDMADQVYLTTEEKYRAIARDIQDCRQRGQPALVGTVSIENSEKLAKMLQAENIPHEVLNAKQHEREAEIVAQAGRPGAVTIATNMAGRGTDIVLGGNPEAEIRALGKGVTPEQIAEIRAAWKQRHAQVLQNGGLHVIGTERHESRRIDNQLRGRSGRQGDPGSSRFYLSLEDSLMRIFASDRVAGMMKKLGMEKDEAIEHPWLTKAIENAQRKVEGRNFDIRKQLLEYDDVANDQRKVVYEQRRELMEAASVEEVVDAIRHDVVQSLINQYIPPNSLDELWNVAGLEEALRKEFMIAMPVAQWLEQDHSLHEQTLRDKIEKHIHDTYKQQEQTAGSALVRHLEKVVMLQVLDKHWKEHLVAMDYLRQGIYLRSYAQKNPKQEYKREAFEMFTQMLENIKQETLGLVTTELFRYSERLEADLKAMEERQKHTMPMQYYHAEAPNALAPEEEAAPPPPVTGKNEPGHTPFVRDQPKVGRNQLCPCGSGKKYKQCHGKLET